MELQTGTIVDRYAVEGLLGQGGMAIVYRVRHQQLGTLHALKVLMLPAQSIRERLLQEGRVQARLRHPNIVNVTDLVEVDGAPGLVMEYIPGPSVDELLRQCDLTLDQADYIARGVLDGVAAAHEVGLVHRDLKPGNILLEVKKDCLLPKITDFGLAKLVGDDAGSGSKTRSGLAMGTPCYMAPEQIRNAKGVDERADVFSLGAVLYELITGRRAFDGDDTFEIFSAVTSGRYTPIRELVPDAPDRMVDAVAAALATDREARPQSVEALAELWAGGVRIPEASVAFAPALLKRAEELGSGVDDRPISWVPSSGSGGSGGAIAPPPRLGGDSNTMDLSLGEEPYDPPEAPSLAQAAAVSEAPRPQPQAQPQSASNRDPRIRRTIVLLSGIVTLGFAGLIGVGLVGSGAFFLARSPDESVRAEARQVPLAQPPPEDAQGRADADDDDAELRDARGAASDAPAPTPAPADAKAKPTKPKAEAEERAQPPPPQPEPASPEEVEDPLAGLADEVEPAEEVEGEDVEEADTGGPPAGPTGHVDVKIALHPMAAGASAIGDVWLMLDGKKYPVPGDVPAGNYTIHASFNHKAPREIGPLTVVAGGAVTLSCYSSTKDCKH